ncbi:MAG: hypothetical protein AB2L07_06140 [Thermoanaerobaculaceae bacterium]
MARRTAVGVLVILALGMVLLPHGAAAQTVVLSNRAAPDPAKPGVLPPGKEPPNDKPGLPLSFPAGIEAVATGYIWSQTTGTYTEITGGTQVTTSCDDTSYNNITLPFTFTYDGTAYTAVSIQCNGFIAMGATVSTSYTPISTGTSNNVIVAIGEDQQTNAADSEIRYETLGTTPNQVFVIQWKNFRHYGATGDIRNYQIRLYETSNLVQVVYGSFTQNATNRVCQVGLRGASNTDFNNRASTGAWTASTAGATNAATMALTTNSVPPSGLTWDWTVIPPSPSFVTSTKSAPAQVAVGDPIAYTVSIVNSGTAPASTATMVDPIPAGTTYVAGSVTGGASYDSGSNSITWAGTVAVGATVTITFSVDTDGAACGETVVNEATLDDPGLAGGPVTKSASTELVSATPSPLNGFEDAAFPPTGWTETIVNDPGTDPDWTRETAGTYPTIAPHGGTAMARFNSYSCPANASARLWTNALDLSGSVAPAVVFWMSHDTGYSGNADRVQVQVSLNGTTWVDVGAPILRYDAAYATPGWGEHVVVLPAGTNVNGVFIGFLGISAYGNNFYLDDTALAEGWYPCPYTSLTPDGARTACPGGTATYPLTLSNMTPNADTFDITIAGNAWPTTPSPAQLTLGPGATGSVTVGVDVPWTPGSDTATVTALGQTHAGTDTATLGTTASSTYWGAIASEPDSGRMDNVLGAWDGKVWSITGYGANLQVRSYNPVTGTWTVVGTPPTFTGNYTRSGCQAGSKVYMYGDTSTAGFTGLWSYDMATTTWAQETPSGTAPVQTGIWAPAWAADAETGTCYLTGGATTPGPGTLATVYVYDPATNAWLTPLASFATVRDYHAAWVFRDATNRKLLCVAGGNTTSSVQLASTQCYDFTAGTWGAEDADIGPLPATLWGMGYAQKVHEGATQLWVTAGVRASAVSATTSFFDVAAGVWADGGTLASGAVYRTSAVTLDNEIYSLGGSIGSFSYTGLANHHIQCAAPPNIDVSPLTLGATQPPDSTTGQPLTIANTGVSDLDWSLVEEPGGGNPPCVAPADVPWLSTQETSGTVAGGASTTFDVLYNSTGLTAGTYTANLCIESNDPDTGPGNGTELVVVPVTLTVEEVPEPSISLVKTVGTASGVCATTSSITVPAGTTVYYCYEVTNTGNVTLNLHDLVDDELGTIFTGLNYALTPGSSVNTVAAGLSIPAVINVTTTNTATWTAYNTAPPDGVTAEASATVTVTFPNIDVDPLSLASTQFPDTTTNQSLSIENTGAAPLEWEILEEPMAIPELVPPGPSLGELGYTPDPAAEAAGLEGGASGPVAPSSPGARRLARQALLTTGLLLVPDSTNDRIMALDPITGNIIDANFVPTNAVVGTGVHAILNAAGDRILLSDQVGDVVHQFDLDGSYIGIFAPAGGANTTILDNIRGVALRPSGNLLVTVASGANSNAVAEFDTAGTYLGTFVAPAAGGLGSPWHPLARASDWLVSGSGGTTGMLRYDLAGAFLDVLAPVSTFPEQMAVASSGNVLVANFSPSTNEGVHEFTSTGTFVGRYDPTGLTGYRGVYELPDGTILTTTGAGVHQIDRSGNLVENKITGVSGRFIQYVVIQTDCTTPSDVPWLSASPINGTTAAGASTPVQVTFDSTGLAPAIYTANLCVLSNDPDPGPGNGTELVVVPVSLTVEQVSEPSISLVKTVGTTSGVCATTASITVPAGTTVYYCYEVTNTGNVTLNLHDLVDDELGTIFTGLNYALTPGSSVNTVAAGLSIPAVINVTTTNTGTWTAYNAQQADLTTAEASATVTVTFPNIDVDPLSLASTQFPNTTTTQPLTVANTGEAPLTWQVIEAQPDRVTRPGITAAPEPVFNVPAVVTSPADCAAFANYPGREPLGYAQHCQPEGAPGANPAAGVLAPTSVGYAQDVGFISDNFVRFTLGNFPGQTVQGTSTNVYFGMDFDATGTTLYALNDTTDELGTINLTDGTFTAIVSCPEPGGANWTGLSIDPVSNLFYASTAANLYTLDPATCSPVLVGPFNISGGVMIDIAVSPSGAMYGHDIGTDSIYTIDTATGAATLVGPTGYAANYAQGMDFDNEDGTLYIFLYVGSGVNHYGTVNLTTGAVTPLASSNPTGEFEGATQTVALCVPTDLSWLSADPTGGTTAASGSTPVQVTFDSTGLVAGAYDGQLCVRSNDPDAGPGNGTELVVVPVSLTVTEAPVPAITLVKTVGTTNGVCATTSAISVDPGTTVYYCYTVTNTGNVTLNLHDLADDELGTIFSGLNYALTPGSSVNTVAAGLSIPAVINTTTTNTATWTAYNASAADTTTAQASATVTVIDTPGVSLVKTVGTTNGVCATTSSISVTAGTTVYYCYEVTNTGNVTLSLHDLVDDRLGTIFTGLAYALTPGSSVNTVAAGLSIPAVINVTTTNTATWTAYNAGPTNSTTAQASATVTALQPANVTGSKAVSGDYVAGGAITYTITLTNSGPGPQPDDPASDELVDVLPASLTATGASTSSGTVLRVGNQVSWNGAIPAGGSVTITITATINQVPGGTLISNQGTIRYDATGDGINDSTRLTDDPVPPGATDPTVFTVRQVDPIPTLDGAGLLLLILLLGGAAVYWLRRIA